MAKAEPGSGCLVAVVVGAPRLEAAACVARPELASEALGVLAAIFRSQRSACYPEVLPVSGKSLAIRVLAAPASMQEMKAAAMGALERPRAFGQKALAARRRSAEGRSTRIGCEGQASPSDKPAEEHCHVESTLRGAETFRLGAVFEHEEKAAERPGHGPEPLA